MPALAGHAKTRDGVMPSVGAGGGVPVVVVPVVAGGVAGVVLPVVAGGVAGVVLPVVAVASLASSCRW